MRLRAFSCGRRYVNDNRLRVDGDKNMRLLAFAFTIVFVWTGPEGHTLDLIITRTSEKLIDVSPKIDHYLSDHASVLCSLNANIPPLKTQKVTYRRLKAINITILNRDLADSSLCYDSPDDVDATMELLPRLSINMPL